MSLIPSKRVDRIYPVVPPLCLLLAAQIAGGFRIKQTDERVLQWSAAALLFSIVFTGGYTAAKVLSDCRDNANHLEVFSRVVKEQAVAHHWRYEVISGGARGSSEGMLLLLALATDLFKARNPDWREVMLHACRLRLALEEGELRSAEKEMRLRLNGTDFDESDVANDPLVRRGKRRVGMWKALAERCEDDDVAVVWNQVIRSPGDLLKKVDEK
jgi:hypothetical protein